MARYLLIALLVALVCFMQTYSAPADAQNPDPVQETLKNAQEQLNKLFNADNLSKTFNENFNSLNETFTKAFADSKPAIDQLVAKGQEILASMIPKTDEAKSPSP